MQVCVSSVVGPALTFRIRQNEHNMTAAEVAAKAGEAGKHTNTNLPTVRRWTKGLQLAAQSAIHRTMPNQMCGVFFPPSEQVFVLPFTPTVSEKHFLESETGLKILQSGVGEVRTYHCKPHGAPGGSYRDNG